ncbi:DNA polymerase III subunit delta' [soil metagenome]
MIVWDIPAQERAVAVLSGAVERDDIGHAWAFVGPPDVGQQQAARAFAAAANGVLDDPAQTGRFLRGAHPAYREFLPSGTSHLIGDVRGQWLDAANATVKEGRVKVLRIVAADRMNSQAANAFLKALEEPPPGTVWILDLTDPEEVPDTILSRCRVVTFGSWAGAQLDALAAELGLGGDDAALAVRVAMGAPTTLRRLADPVMLQDYRTHRDWLPRVRQDGPGYALVASHALKSEVSRRVKAIEAEGAAALEGLEGLYGDTPPRAVVKDLEERYKRLSRAEQTTTIQQALDDVVGWCRDALVIGGGGGADAVRNVDAIEALREQADAVSAAALLEICDRALHTREAIEVNVKWDLAIEAFVLGAHSRSLQG